MDNRINGGPGNMGVPDPSDEPTRGLRRAQQPQSSGINRNPQLGGLPPTPPRQTVDPRNGPSGNMPIAMDPGQWPAGLRADVARVMGAVPLHNAADLPELLRTVNLDKLPTALLLNRLAGVFSHMGMSLDDVAGERNPRIRSYLLSQAAQQARVPEIDVKLAVDQLRHHGEGNSVDDASMLSIGKLLSTFFPHAMYELNASAGMHLARHMRAAKFPDQLLDVAKGIRAWRGGV